MKKLGIARPARFVQASDGGGVTGIRGHAAPQG
jgi:hypothetical protein